MSNTDWLNTRPVFYHEKTGLTGDNPEAVVDFNNFEWDWEGLDIYLRYGYCAYTYTPVKHVRFLPPLSNLNHKGLLTTPPEEAERIFQRLQRKSKVDEVWAIWENLIASWKKNISHEADIILPLSGGLDSRLLLYFLHEIPQLKTFTYGISRNQEKNMEVVRARALAAQSKVPWEQIRLGDFLKWLPEWNRLFTFSTHAHGMYQMEFYHHIASRLGNTRGIVVSGIIGDAWAGSIKTPHITQPDDLYKLALSHGLNADTSFLINKINKNGILEHSFELQKEVLQDASYVLVLLMQNKMMLLRYLTMLPEQLGFRTFAPYLDQSLALAMATLPDKQRENRIWQRDFFEKKAWNIESRNQVYESFNFINYLGVIKNPLEPLSVKILNEIFEPAYIENINKRIQMNLKNRLRLEAHYRFHNKRILWRFMKDNFLQAYFAYLTLYPLQKIIEKRNAHLAQKNG